MRVMAVMIVMFCQPLCSQQKGPATEIDREEEDYKTRQDDARQKGHIKSLLRSCYWQKSNECEIFVT